MRIKRLDITGFKSFMDRTVFSFDDAITAVVGPNGCGKSNVVDAIRWAMGEQSAKNLRGRGMEDVIFNGSENHAPLSMAEVTLTFAVDQLDVLPPTLAGLPEVSVTRRLFRSGESEYQLNRTTCRLLDITELFLGTGVGTRAYSIIEQGRVGQIVSARPEDRRSFIEEAAGVTKYKARRKAAERKLEYTDQNLLRVTDVVKELSRRLESLERQAKKAEKYRRLRAEMREIELHHSSHRYLELSAHKQMLDLQLATLSLEERASWETLKTGEADVTTRRDALESDSEGLERSGAELHALQGELKLDEQNLLHWGEDEKATAQRVTQAQDELEEVLRRTQAVDQQRADREAELEKLGLSSREDEVALQVREEEQRRTDALAEEVSTRLESERKQLVDLATRLANHETGLKNLEERRAELTQRTGRLEGEVEVLKAEEAQLESSRREVLERVEQSRQLAVELTQRKGEEESTLTRVREAFAENEVMVIALREDLSDKRSRLQSLEEIQRNYEGFDRGVRAVMLRAGNEPRQVGVFGLVADVLSAPVEYEKAIEAALGERLQHVIVETPDRAVELVGYLKSQAEGRSTFIPVPELSETTPAQAPVSATPALLVVQVKDDVLRPVVEQLLRDVYLAPSLDDARLLAMDAPLATFVTPEGEVLRPGQVLTGGNMEGPAVGALQKKREIGELTEEVARIEQRYNELITRHYELQKQVGHSEGVLKGLEKNHHAEELSLTTHEKDLSQAGSSLVKLRERLGQLAAEQRQLDESARILEHDVESARGEVAFGQTDRAAREDRVRLLEGEALSLEARAEALALESTSLKVKVASSGERGEAARREHEQALAALEELKIRAARLEVSLDETRAHRAELLERLEGTRAGLKERQAKVEALKGDVELRRAAHTEAVAKVREDEAALKAVRERLDSLTHGLSQMSIKDRELGLEMEHLSAQVEERHQISIDEVIHQYHLLPQLGAEAKEQLKELRGQIERMGEVNVTAIEEHQEIKERHAFLSAQQQDLTDSIKQLREAIAKIDETSRVRFKETFDVVNEKFQQIFPRLFGGGRASLHLTADVPGQEPGVEILAQPPGKKLQNMMLLSGGEKALTAVALIFAIFLIKPTPFCLLDEVDAPLDEGNVGRYNDMVKEMSSQSQFILITHNKRTMEVGDTLYGVTMEEPGCSKLVSVKMREAVAANEDQNVA